MKKRLGNFFVLIGLISLVIFFTSSAIILDAGWFLLGGIGFTSLGLLIRRRALSRRDRQKKKRRKRRNKRDPEDE